MPPAPPSASDPLADTLPFAVDDHQAVNAAFVRWHASRAPEDFEPIEVWAYCYARQYFAQKFVRSTALQPSDYDALVTKAFTSVKKYYGAVRDPSRFAHWVSVVYKRTFLRYIDRRRETVELESERLADPVLPAPWREHDQRVIRRAVRAALGRLPEFLQPVAQLRLVEQMEYEDISDRTGHAVPTVRAYVCKVMARLREDPDIRSLRDEYFE